MRDIPFLSVSGTNLDCGEAVGRAFSEQIRSNYATYMDIVHGKTGARQDDVRAYCDLIVPAIEAYAPDLMDEVRGIAKGSGIPLPAVLALNARTELMYGLQTANGKPVADTECTSLGARPEVTADGHTIIGENWDWKTAVADRTVVLEIETPRSARALVFTEAGFVGKIGINEHGIAVCANLLTSSHDRGQPGVPYHFILRKVLDAPNLHHAIRAVTFARRGSSGNYLIGAAGGEIVDLEATPECVEQLLPTGGIVAHANHFSSALLAPFDTHKDLSTLTVIRQDRACRLLDRERGAITANSFGRVFRDHFSFPHSICRHTDETLSALERTMTGASIVMDLEERVMHIAAGPPCENSYRQLALRSSGVQSRALGT